MASVSGVSGSSSTSSLFAGKNILTGLGSGLDTESMIENSVKGYQLKVTSLTQQQTKVEWKQDAVREHIDALHDFMNKYTSTSSKTNLSSASFFTAAQTTSVSGTHAGKVAASGKSTSDIEVLGATMATAATYSLSGALLGSTFSTQSSTVNALSWDDPADGSQPNLADYLNGKTLTVGSGAGAVSLTIGDLSGEDNKTAKLVESLQNQLDQQNSGITVNADGGKLRFTKADGTVADVTRFSNADGTAANIADNPGGLSFATSAERASLSTSSRIVDFLAGDSSRSMTINGVTIEFDEETTISELFNKINNSDANLTVSFSKITNDIVFTAKETGSSSITFDDNTAKKLFGGGQGVGNASPLAVATGTNAMLTAKVNGREVTIQNASNQFDLDGLTLTVKGSFQTKANEDALTFQTSTDQDKIVDAVKEFVNDYNSIVKNLYSAFNTQPATKSDKSSYNPLSEEDKADMSDSAVKAYEEKAKQGILFGDDDLKALFSSLRSVISTSDPSVQRAMNELGLSTSYADGVTTLKLDEDQLRTSLDKDPNIAKNFFADSPGYKTYDGFAGKMKAVMTKYADTSIANTGILVKKAGTKLSSVSLLDNDYLREIDKIQEQIDTWNTKMLKQVDFYTRLFSKLEQTMNTMNSQSSALAGLMGS